MSDIQHRTISDHLELFMKLVNWAMPKLEEMYAAKSITNDEFISIINENVIPEMANMDKLKYTRLNKFANVFVNKFPQFELRIIDSLLIAEDPTSNGTFICEFDPRNYKSCNCTNCVTKAYGHLVNHKRIHFTYATNYHSILDAVPHLPISTGDIEDAIVEAAVKIHDIMVTHALAEANATTYN